MSVLELDAAAVALKRYEAQKSAYLEAGGSIDDERPCVDDDKAGYDVDWQYHLMNLWAFRGIYAKRPRRHVDVASQPGFLTILSEFVPVTFVDLRDPGFDKLGNLSYKAGDITSLPFVSDSLESVSCLHVAEHIGLGRYGDAINPQGFVKACRELVRVVAPGGMLYFAVPMGRPKVVFNAHRVISPAEIRGIFADLSLDNFSAVLTDGRFLEGTLLDAVENERYACGMMAFRKEW